MSTSIDINTFATAASELPDDTLHSVKTQLQNSIVKLEATNNELQQEIDNLKSDDDRANLDDVKLYQETIEENNGVIGKQKERVEKLDNEISKRGLSSSSKDKGVYL